MNTFLSMSNVHQLQFSFIPLQGPVFRLMMLPMWLLWTTFLLLITAHTPVLPWQKWLLTTLSQEPTLLKSKCMVSVTIFYFRKKKIRLNYSYHQNYHYLLSKHAKCKRMKNEWTFSSGKIPLEKLVCLLFSVKRVPITKSRLCVSF